MDDLREIIRGDQNLHGEPGLWLCVILDAVETIRAGPSAAGYSVAVDFVLSDGGMFEVYCQSIDVDADGLRKRIVVGKINRETKR